MRAFFQLATLAAALALASCIDGREELWLAADGSGRADVTYSFPAAAARFRGGAAGVRKLVEAAIAQNPALSEARCEVNEADGRIVLHVVAAFASAREMTQETAAAKVPSQVAALAGVVTLDAAGREVSFSRRIDAAKALPGAKYLPDAALAGRKLVYIVHLPVPPDSTNATAVRDGGTTLEWDIPLKSAVARPIDLRFRGTVPLPAWVAPAAGAAVAGAVAACLLALGKWRRRRVISPTAPTA